MKTFISLAVLLCAMCSSDVSAETYFVQQSLGAKEGDNIQIVGDQVVKVVYATYLVKYAMGPVQDKDQNLWAQFYVFRTRSVSGQVGVDFDAPEAIRIPELMCSGESGFVGISSMGNEDTFVNMGVVSPLSKMVRYACGTRNGKQAVQRPIVGSLAQIEEQVKKGRVFKVEGEDAYVVKGSNNHSMLAVFLPAGNVYKLVEWHLDSPCGATVPRAHAQDVGVTGKTDFSAEDSKYIDGIICSGFGR